MDGQVRVAPDQFEQLKYSPDKPLWVCFNGEGPYQEYEPTGPVTINGELCDGFKFSGREDSRP